MFNISNSRVCRYFLTGAKLKINGSLLAGGSSVLPYSTSLQDEQEYLHRSILPTDYFQKSLLHLPIPKLEDSCRRYLNALQPLVDLNQFERSKKMVEAFQKEQGIELQSQLVATDKKNKHTNYVSEPWFDMYLKDRRSIVLTHNPFMCFQNDTRPGYNDPLVRTTNFIISSLRFMKTIRANILEPEVYHLDPIKSDTTKFRRFVKMLPRSVASYGAYWYKAYPLDMSQYGRLFNSTRIPRPIRDELYTDTTAKHVLFIKNSNFYIFDVLDRDGNILPASDIMAHIKYIMKSGASKPSHPLGMLTTLDRNTWSATREKLLVAGNADQISKIDSAIFAIALDDVATENVEEISKLFLYGDGSNRWFDKSFTLVVTQSGLSGMNFEHAWGDGVAVLRYFNDIANDMENKPRVHPNTQPAAIDSSNAVKKLEFHLTNEIQKVIEEATAEFKRRTLEVDIKPFIYDKFGKNYIKNKKLSPDSIMQLGFQLAFFKQHGQTVATYESCSTAAFKHGRTETVRPATMATKNTCELISKTTDKPSVQELMHSITECSKAHHQLTVEAATGKGFDRHLFSLKNLAEQQGMKPDIFADPSYALMNHIILSTSTLSADTVLMGGFAAVVPDGYGIGYNCKDTEIGSNISCFVPARNVGEFIQCLEESFNDIYTVLEKSDSPK